VYKTIPSMAREGGSDLLSTIMPKNPVMAMPNPMGTPRKEMAKKRACQDAAAANSAGGSSSHMGRRSERSHQTQEDHRHPLLR